ncbi:MAG: hypothetical protein P8X70_02395, partial [Nanoarchaeota archaeon]
MEEENKQNKLNKFHDKNHKLLLLIPAILLVFSLIYMGVFYSNNHDFIHKDISLTGGTSVTINDKINTDELKQSLSDKLENIKTREIYDLITREQIATIIETKSDEK